MRILTINQSRELDRISMDNYGIPGIDLMGAAGVAIAKEAKAMIAEIHDPRIIIVCGKGNNGGDGFAAAQNLDDYAVRIYSLANSENISGDSAHFYDMCIEKNIFIEYGYEIPEDEVKGDLIIDALLGTGFRGELRDDIIRWTTWINQMKSPVLSIDCPTGLDGNRGKASKGAISADKTITMGFPKLGLTIKDGPGFTGELNTADIGFPDVYNELDGLKWSQFQEEDVKNGLQPIKRDTYKHRQGKVLIIAGSKGMTGAAVLSTFGALRAGAGLTVTCAPESIEEIYEKTIIEGLTIGCSDKGQGFLIPESYGKIEEKFEWCNAIVIGPGLGNNSETIELITKVALDSSKPIVIDADGLRMFHGNLDLFRKLTQPFIITPHEGEFCDLLGIKQDEYGDDYPVNIENFLDDFPGVLVLKNAPTLTCYLQKAVVNSSGNPGMATGGTGDVLAGMIGTFIAQGSEPFEAAQTAVFLHGKAADVIIEEKGKRGLIASDLLEILPSIIKEYE